MKKNVRKKIPRKRQGRGEKWPKERNETIGEMRKKKRDDRGRERRNGRGGGWKR